MNPIIPWHKLHPIHRALIWAENPTEATETKRAAVQAQLRLHIAQRAQNKDPTHMSTICNGHSSAYTALVPSTKGTPQTKLKHPRGAVECPTPTLSTESKMTFTIEADVPMPKRQGGRTGSKYPFAALDIGESFLVPHGADKEVNVGTLRSALGAFKKRNPDSGKFSVRTVEGGVRVWRTE